MLNRLMTPAELSDAIEDDASPKSRRQILISDRAIEALDRLAEHWGLYTATGSHAGAPNRSAAIERAIVVSWDRERPDLC